MFLSEMKMFIENSKLKKPTPMNFEDGCRSLRIAEAIKKSMTEKVLVNIEKTIN